MLNNKHARHELSHLNLSVPDSNV